MIIHPNRYYIQVRRDKKKQVFMTFEEILSQFKQGIFAPVYFLTGSEPWFADYIADYIAKHALKEEEKAFNQTIMYGRDTNVIDLIMAARRYPMMAPRQVIILKEAQDLNSLATLESYLKAYAPTTTLVLCHKYKNVDRRTGFWKALKNKEFVVLESKQLYENQVDPWIKRYVKGKGLTIEPKAAAMLIENLGTSLTNISLALNKLKVAIGPGEKNITAPQVAQYIGISKDYSPFELQNAILQRDIMKANRIAAAFGHNVKTHPIQATIGVLFAFFSKLIIYLSLKDKSSGNVASVLKISPYFVRNYQAAAQNYSILKVKHTISLLREYDMRSKGFNNNSTTPGELLREMIFKIMH